MECPKCGKEMEQGMSFPTPTSSFIFVPDSKRKKGGLVGYSKDSINLTAVAGREEVTWRCPNCRMGIVTVFDTGHNPDKR